MVRFFHSYLLKKLWEIFICCKNGMVVFLTLFLNLERMGWKNLLLAEQGRKLEHNILKILMWVFQLSWCNILFSDRCLATGSKESRASQWFWIDNIMGVQLNISCLRIIITTDVVPCSEITWLVSFSLKSLVFGSDFYSLGIYTPWLW